MRDLQASELSFVYGAGGGGRSCSPPPCGKGGSNKHSSKQHDTRKCGGSNKHGTRGGSRCG